MTSATLVMDARDIVGESAVWSVARQELLWVDIVGRRIHRLDPRTGRHRLHPVHQFPTSIGLTRGGGAIVGCTKSVMLWDLEDVFTKIAIVEPELPDNRLNEGRVAPDGSFWVGTMQNNLTAQGAPKDVTANLGALHRITADGHVTCLSADRFGICNTLAWTDDGRLLTADTLANRLWSYRVGPDGSLTGRRDFGEPYARGLPDGSALDADGYLWNCRVVGGGCVARFAPDGSVDRVLEVPCSWPTSCTFGGPDLDVLYVTSARFTMSDQHLVVHPLEGGLFALHPGVRGRAEYLFAA